MRHPELSVFVRLTLTAVLLLTVAGTVNQARAQAASRPNVAAIIFSPDGKGSSARIFTPAKSDGRELLKINARLNAILSPDAASVVLYGTIDDQGNFAATYGSVAQPTAKSIPIEKGFTFIGGSFSPSGKSFAYTLAKLPEDPKAKSSFEYGLLDVTSGATKRFAGVFADPVDNQGKPFPVPPAGYFGGPLTIAWLDENRQVISPFFPFSDGALDGLYVLDVSKAQSGQLPAATPLSAQVIPGISSKAFSATGTKVVYAYPDGSRPVPNYEGPYDAFNTIGVLDVASGKSLTIPAPKDNGTGSALTLSPDGSKAYFTAGKYALDTQTGVPILPFTNLFIIDTTTGVSTQGPALTNDKLGFIDQMVACGTTLYFALSQVSQSANMTTLVAAELADPAKQTIVFSSPGYISLAGCAP